MNKTRVETLSDGVFAISMTILIFNIHVPSISDGAYSVLGLMNALLSLTPHVLSYVISFTVLAMYWTSHHALFHFFTKTIDRTFVQLNMLYLMFLAFIPFSTDVLGTYHANVVSFWVYGGNIVAMGIVAYLMFHYVLRSTKIDRHEISSRTITQAKIRLLLTPAFAILAMCMSLVSTTLAFPLFVIPVIFNLMPGSLDRAERFLGITIR
jgi:uncharacterized membrane protein